MYDIGIIGGGTAGMTAAIYGQRAGKRTIIIEGGTFGGQITSSPNVENYPGIASVSGSEFSMNLLDQAMKLGAETQMAQVTGIRDEGEVKVIVTPEKEYPCRSIVLATGVTHRHLGVPNEERLTGAGVSYCATCDGMFFRGKEVAVVGGGNVAMDAARTALRLGAEVHVVYRRSEAELPARVEEVHHAKEEGIIFDLLTNPVEILTDDKDWVTGIRCIRMELGEPDASGRRRPVEIEGSEYDIEVDTVIMSLGTSPNPLISSTTKGLDVNRRKSIVADEENGQTSKEGVFAGGDAVTGAATVILAMGAGKAGAKGIDEYLKNKEK